MEPKKIVMEARVVTANGLYDLSNIHTEKELKEQISFFKSSLAKEEDELEEHFRRLPQQLVKSTADSLLPSFLNKIIANGTWKILLSSLAMFANPFSRGFSIKKNIVGSAKKLGLIALLKGAYNYWSNRKDPKNKMAANLKKAPAVTTLNTKKPKQG